MSIFVSDDLSLQPVPRDKRHRDTIPNKRYVAALTDCTPLLALPH
jgi:hypothetical protein